MQSLIRIIENLKNSEIKNTIDSRIKEFSELGKKSINEIFKEMCFCLLTANSRANTAMNIQNQFSHPNKGQVIYINDGSKGLRRITDREDTGWFKADDLRLRMQNSDQVRHYMLRI